MYLERLDKYEDLEWWVPSKLFGRLRRVLGNIDAVSTGPDMLAAACCMVEQTEASCRSRAWR